MHGVAGFVAFLLVVATFFHSHGAEDPAHEGYFCSGTIEQIFFGGGIWSKLIVLGCVGGVIAGLNVGIAAGVDGNANTHLPWLGAPVA